MFVFLLYMIHVRYVLVRYHRCGIDFKKMKQKIGMSSAEVSAEGQNVADADAMMMSGVSDMGSAAGGMVGGYAGGTFASGGNPFAGLGGASAGGAGGTPGQAIEGNVASGATVTVTNASGATIQSGRGGPGGGGGPGKGGYRDDPEGKGESCYYYVTGSSGAAGAQAAYGSAGNAGAAGSHHATYDAGCGLSGAGANPGAGGAASAAAKAINYGGHSVTLNNSGTVNGATS